MNVFVKTYKEHFNTSVATTSDYALIECEQGIMIGVDKEGVLSVIIESSTPRKTQFVRKTQNMHIECNARVTCTVNDRLINNVVHILKCLSTNTKEQELFLELASILILNGDRSEDSLIEIFNILRSFFSDKREVSDNELIGLYAELYTIHIFHQSLYIEKYWQSRDRMKFDFSLSEEIKLEVKATTKNSRTHHFKHEQLMTDLYNIFVISYMLRYDDEGLPLYDLILECKELLFNAPKKLLKLNTILKNASQERLINLKFNTVYTEQNRHFYKAVDIPKFNENTPHGVINAEYDCVLDNIDFLTDEEFINYVKNN